jgi:hypothetical protein
MSVLDYVHLGASLSLRSFARMGASSLSVGLFAPRIIRVHAEFCAIRFLLVNL